MKALNVNKSVEEFFLCLMPVVRHYINRKKQLLKILITQKIDFRKIA